MTEPYTRPHPDALKVRLCYWADFASAIQLSHFA